MKAWRTENGTVNEKIIKAFLLKKSKMITNDAELFAASKNLEGTPFAGTNEETVKDMYHYFGWMGSRNYSDKWGKAYNLLCNILICKSTYC